jgi:hypothetical protein
MHSGALIGEQRDPVTERQVCLDRADDLQKDLKVPPSRLEQQRLQVSEMLPDSAKRYPGARGDTRRRRSQIAFSVQRAHGIDNGPAGVVRPGHAAVGWLDIG